MREGGRERGRDNGIHRFIKLDPYRVSMRSGYTFEKFRIGRDMLDGIY